MALITLEMMQLSTPAYFVVVIIIQTAAFFITAASLSKTTHTLK